MREERERERERERREERLNKNMTMKHSIVAANTLEITFSKFFKVNVIEGQI